MKFIYIEWLDSATMSGWQFLSDNAPVKIQSIGHLAKETDTEIVITTSVSDSGKGLDLLAIPREAITKRKWVKV